MSLLINLCYALDALFKENITEQQIRDDLFNGGEIPQTEEALHKLRTYRYSQQQRIPEEWEDWLPEDDL